KEKPKAEKPSRPADLPHPPGLPDMPKDILEQKDINPREFGRGVGIGVPIPNAIPGDNSNTQFATLGLWVAKRHGVPADEALAMIERRFRATQNADGGWGYITGNYGNTSSPQMTCAGLIGVAVGYGATNQRVEKANAEGAIYGKDGKQIKTGKDKVG